MNTDKRPRMNTEEHGEESPRKNTEEHGKGHGETRMNTDNRAPKKCTAAPG